MTAADLGIPEAFNAAAYYVDRHLESGRGGHVALECGDESITYAEVCERVTRTGAALRDRLGVRREERVPLVLPDCPEFVYAFFGAMRIGAVPVPLNTLWRARDFEYALNDARARVAIVDARLLAAIQSIDAGRLPFLRELVVVGDAPAATIGFDALVRDGDPHDAPAATSRDDVALWLYSSGSTGAPKACVHLHHDIPVCTELYGRRVLGIAPGDRCFGVAKLFFAYGLVNVLCSAFAVGAAVILWPGAPAPPAVFQMIERHRPTLFFSVPTSYAMLLAHHADGDRPDFDLSSIRHAVSAGEALPPALFARFKQRFGIEILDGIGSTELLNIFISNTPGHARPGSSGRVVQGYEVMLLDDDGRPTPTGEIGSLFVKGDSACACYWNRHEATKQTIRGEWVRTGDRYSQSADGYFYYAGRNDDMLKVGGIWVSPIEVEHALMAHADVHECAVIGREDHDRLIKPCAFVVLRQGVNPRTDLATQLQTFVRERLAEYKRPRWVEFVDELPKTATGKLQRFKLRDT